MGKLNSVCANLFNRVEGCLTNLGVLAVHGMIERSDDAVIGHALEVGQRRETLLRLPLFESAQQHVGCGPAAWDAHFLFASEGNQPWRFRWRAEGAWHARVERLPLFKILVRKIADCPLVVFHL